jgi:hypothetical protein
VHSFHFRPDRVPGFSRFPLGHPHQQQGHPAQRDVGANPVFFAVMDGAKFERGLQGPECALHLKDPAAAQDIDQETFLSAFAALKALRSEQAFPS